jgi:hypothetical protein
MVRCLPLALVFLPSRHIKYLKAPPALRMQGSSQLFSNYLELALQVMAKPLVRKKQPRSVVDW